MPQRSLALLLLANLVPLAGVLFFGWSAVTILGVYWIESLVIGVFTVLKILTSRSSNGRQRLPTGLFFLIHYGVFAFVHGSFLHTMLDLGGPSAGGGGQPEGLTPLDHLLEFVDALAVHGENIPIALLGLVASHGASYVLNFWIGGEREHADLRTLMFAPYPRVVVMHITVLAGGLLVTRVGEPLALLIVLIVVKVVLDARGHLRERRKLAEPTTP